MRWIFKEIKILTIQFLADFPHQDILMAKTEFYCHSDEITLNRVDFCHVFLWW